MTAVLSLHFDRTVLLRVFLAGSAWGIAMAAGFFGIALWQCGLPCPDDVAFTTLVCVATGLVTIGPFAAINSTPPQRSAPIARIVVTSSNLFLKAALTRHVSRLRVQFSSDPFRV